MEASVPDLIVGGAPFGGAIRLAEPGVEIGQTERAARLARLMQHVVGALGLQAGEDLVEVERL